MNSHVRFASHGGLTAEQQDDDAEPVTLHIQTGLADTTPLASGAPLESLAIVQRSEVTFIESDVPDLQTLLDGLGGAEVHVIDSSQDGLQQIAAILAGRSGIDALHIISHGASASLDLGALTLNNTSIATHQAELSAIGQSLSAGADIMLYGCDVGAGTAGQVFIEQLANATGADVAASTNLTGSAALGGDWNLEISTGHIETKAVVDPALAAHYQQLLAVSRTVTFSSPGFFANNGDASTSAGDVLYNVTTGYQLKINGLTKGVANYNGGYIVSDSSSSGETEIDFSFNTGQVFTPTSLWVGNYGSKASQKLIFTGFDAAGNQVGTVQTATTSSSNGSGNLVTVNLSGLTNIATLKLTAAADSTAPGKLVYLIIDDFALSNIQPTPPTVTGVSASTSDGSYTVGQNIALTVTFSAAVTVTGTPQLLLATGGSGHSASYVSGSGTTTLTFNYTVLTGDNSADLDAFSTTALSLNGGSISSTSGASIAALTLPTPGTVGSLGANKNIVIDTTAPNAPSTPSMTSGSDTGSSSSDHITSLTTPTFNGLAESGSLVKLYDTDGTTLLGSATAVGGTWTITSSALAQGLHSITAKATDAVGNVGAASSSLSVVIDTSAPAAPTIPVLASGSDSGTSSSDHITNVTTPTFSGITEAGATLKLYDTDGTTLLGSTVADGSGNWSVVSSILAAGAHSITAKATDMAGNTGAASAASNITVDTTAPTVSITSNVASLKTGETATITFTFSEDPGASFNWDGSSGDVVVSNGTLSAISGSGLTRTATFSPAAATDSTSASITVTAASYQDVAGNNGGAGTSPSLTVDTLANAPTIQGLNAASDSGTLGDGITNVSSPTLTGHGEAGASVRLYDTDGTTQLGSATADGGGNWSITSSNLSSGSHTLTARQTDVAGNLSVASSGYSYVLDTMGPTSIALSTTTLPMASASNGSTLATLSATDITAVTYGFRVGNGIIDADNSKFTISGTQLVAAQTLTAGSYHLYTKATDAAGNQSYQTFTLNVVDAPTVSSIVRVGSAAVSGNSASVSYTVTFSQAVSGVDVTDFSLFSTGNASGTVASLTGSGTTYTVIVNSLAGDGNLRLDLKSSGTGIVNGSSTAISGGYSAGQSFTLDHAAPAAPSTPAMSFGTDTGASSSDGITSNTTPVFSGAGEAGAIVTLYDTDGVSVLGTAVATGGVWSITSSTLSTGSHTLTARQSDDAGNISAASAGLTVVVDTSTAPPSTPLLSVLSDSGTLGDGITNIATPTVTGTAEANATVTLYDTDGISVLGTAIATSGVWSIASSALSNGSHTLTAKQTDLAGNISAASAALSQTINTTVPAAPSVPVLSAASDSGTLGDGITNIASPVITGTAAANAVVRLYDSNGSTVLGTATTNGTGNWSMTSSALAVGVHNLTAKQADVAGNVSVASSALALTIEAAPVAPFDPAPAPTIDGVLVTRQTISLPGGGSGTQTIIPIVTTERVDSSGSGAVADIPLVTGSSGTLLLAQLPPGFGLTASGGASQSAGVSSDQLSKTILAVSSGNTVSEQNHLVGNASTFLKQLASSVPLLVETIVPSAGTTAPVGALTLTGTSNADQHTALIIDASHLPTQSNLVLNSVDFAAVVGSANITGNTNGQIITGDAANQQFTVAPGSASTVFAGGGNDTLHVTASASSTASTVDASTTLLHGGTGNDTAQFDGASANYTVQTHEGYVVVAAKAQPGQQVVVINAENLAFSDTTVAIQTRDTDTTLVGLYKEALGRQADYLGFDYWANMQKTGTSLGQIAIAILNSNESKAQHVLAFNGNSSNDIEVLYQGIYGRHSEANGLAYWVNAMQQGMTLEQVAQNFATANEMTAHKIAVQNWDFLV